ncbi:hypothetical protein E4U19_006426 [Claviceps sp. Clav32 group G5]|nr:hypothetical protein E4U19_006426 [Claviceps sp. Clav32 group G5]KAG6046623.1 hypothetical protein E4U39_001173 [Claviceps sp. Clav50 group G5]
MLTATLPLHMERELKETMLLVQDPCWLLRASTARKYTRYMVKSTVADGKLINEAIKVCKAKMIVFCCYKNQCEILAAALGCNYFYAGSSFNTDFIQRWKTSGGCVVATSLLGTGVNYKDVALTVHVGLPYGLIDFAQESGRAGRDGEVVASFILLEKNWLAVESERRPEETQEWSVDEKKMIAFVNTEGRRRLVLGKSFDGNSAQDCKSGDMERCDRYCPGVSDSTRSQKEMSVERDRVEDVLDQIAIGCPVCWVTSALGFGPESGCMHKAWGQACTQR